MDKTWPVIAYTEEDFLERYEYSKYDIPKIRKAAGLPKIKRRYARVEKEDG